MSNYLQADKDYNAAEFLKYVEDEIQKPGNENNRYELINGQIYMMSSPNEIHYDLSRFIEKFLDSYFEKTDCKVYHAPFDLFLLGKNRVISLKSAKRNCKDVAVPDLMVVCDKNKRKLNGVHGAPDLIIEVVSKSSIKTDYFEKLYSYMHSGVREYWIIDPMKRKAMVYTRDADGRLLSANYNFSDAVRSETFDALCVDFAQFQQETYSDDE